MNVIISELHFQLTRLLSDGVSGQVLQFDS